MRLINRISVLAGLFGATLMAVTGAFLTYEVVARYFFIKPTTWAAEVSQLCLIWGCLLAMAWVLTLRQHITVNALTSLLPRTAQKLCVALAGCYSGFFIGGSRLGLGYFLRELGSWQNHRVAPRPAQLGRRTSCSFRILVAVGPGCLRTHHFVGERDR